MIEEGRVDGGERTNETRRLIEEALGGWLPAASEPPETLHRAMRHAALGGGKRFRGILCVETHRLLAGGDTGVSIDAACALETLHAYTLVHDDLPALDDDAVRRGAPSCHAAFGEATAILAGDALQTLAFEILARCDAPPERRVAAIAALAGTAGSRRLVGGQQADMEGEGKRPTMELVTFIHERKTAALVSCAMQIGAIFAGANEDEIDEAADVGMAVGLAFQIADDLLDREGEAAILGKGVRKDDKRGKITWPAAAGADASREHAATLVADAIRRVEAMGDEGVIAGLLGRVIERRS